MANNFTVHIRDMINDKIYLKPVEGKDVKYQVIPEIIDFLDRNGRYRTVYLRENENVIVEFKKGLTTQQARDLYTLKCREVEIGKETMENLKFMHYNKIGLAERNYRELETHLKINLVNFIGEEISGTLLDGHDAIKDAIPAIVDFLNDNKRFKAVKLRQGTDFPSIKFVKGMTEENAVELYKIKKIEQRIEYDRQENVRREHEVLENDGPTIQ